MDPQTLPAEELELYKKIKEELKVSFEPLTVGQHRLNLLKCTDLEQILDGKDPLKNVSDFPVWTRLWEAAIVLADFLARQLPPRGTTLLELGGGLGATGIVAAAAGYDVTLTDYEERILDFQRVNAAASNVQNINFQLLDWHNPQDIDQYDIIAGAEILYREEFFEPLLAIFKKGLKPGGTIFLAHDARRRNLNPFLKMAEESFQIAMTKRKLKGFEQDREILLTRLKQK